MRRNPRKSIVTISIIMYRFYEKIGIRNLYPIFAHIPYLVVKKSLYYEGKENNFRKCIIDKIID